MNAAIFLLGLGPIGIGYCISPFTILSSFVEALWCLTRMVAMVSDLSDLSVTSEAKGTQWADCLLRFYTQPMQN